MKTFKNRNGKVIKTFVVTFKSGRKDKIFACDLRSLKTMCNFALVASFTQID